MKQNEDDAFIPCDIKEMYIYKIICNYHGIICSSWTDGVSYGIFINEEGLSTLMEIIDELNNIKNTTMQNAGRNRFGW